MLVTAIPFPLPRRPASSIRIRFDHRIAPANEKDCLVTGAKRPSLIVDRRPRPRIFTIEMTEKRFVVRFGRFGLAGNSRQLENRDLPGSQTKSPSRYPRIFRIVVAALLRA